MLKVYLSLLLVLVVSLFIAGCSTHNENERAFEFVFGKPIPTEIRHIQGIQVDYFLGSAIYLKYEADKDFVLRMVESQPVDPRFYVKSDDKCRPISDEVKFNPQPQDVDHARIPYWKPQEIVNKEIYNCLRCPWLHGIMFDKDSNIVYHVITEIRD